MNWRGGDEQSRGLSQAKLPSGKERDNSVRPHVLEHTSEGKSHVAQGNQAGWQDYHTLPSSQPKAFLDLWETSSGLISVGHTGCEKSFLNLGVFLSSPLFLLENVYIRNGNCFDLESIVT